MIELESGFFLQLWSVLVTALQRINEKGTTGQGGQGTFPMTNGLLHVRGHGLAHVSQMILQVGRNRDPVSS